MRAFEDGGKSDNVAAGINKLRADRGDKITGGAHMIGRNYRTSTAHRFVNDNCKGFVFRGKHHEIGRGVDGRKLRLIDEAEKSDPRGDAQSGGFRFELRTKRAFAGEDQERTRKLG